MKSNETKYASKGAHVIPGRELRERFKKSKSVDHIAEHPGIYDDVFSSMHYGKRTLYVPNKAASAILMAIKDYNGNIEYRLATPSKSDPIPGKASIDFGNKGDVNSYFHELLAHTEDKNCSRKISAEKFYDEIAKNRDEAEKTIKKLLESGIEKK